MHLFSISKLYEFLITVGVRNSFCGVVHCIDHCAIQVFFTVLFQPEMSCEHYINAEYIILSRWDGKELHSWYCINFECSRHFQLFSWISYEIFHIDVDFCPVSTYLICMMLLKVVWKKFGNMYICTFLKYELGLLVSSVARFNSTGEPFIVYWLA